MLHRHDPRKLQHTPGAHPRQSHYPTMKGFPSKSLLLQVYRCVPFRCVKTTLDMNMLYLLGTKDCFRSKVAIWGKEKPLSEDVSVGVAGPRHVLRHVWVAYLYYPCSDPWLFFPLIFFSLP